MSDLAEHRAPGFRVPYVRTFSGARPVSLFRRGCSLVALESAYVLHALKYRRVSAVPVAHAPLHFAHRFVLVQIHPVEHILFERVDMPDTMYQEGRAKHRHIGPYHEHLD